MERQRRRGELQGNSIYIYIFTWICIQHPHHLKLRKCRGLQEKRKLTNWDRVHSSFLFSNRFFDSTFPKRRKAKGDNKERERDIYIFSLLVLSKIWKEEEKRPDKKNLSVCIPQKTQISCRNRGETLAVRKKERRKNICQSPFCNYFSLGNFKSKKKEREKSKAESLLI